MNKEILNKFFEKKLQVKKLLSLALCCITLSLPACSQNGHATDVKVSDMKNGNYVRNGDFEKVAEGKLSNWKVSGEVQSEAASGAWKRLTARFRSGPHETVGFFFTVPRGASGSVWIDNFVVGYWTFEC